MARARGAAGRGGFATEREAACAGGQDPHLLTVKKQLLDLVDRLARLISQISLISLIANSFRGFQ